MFFMWKFWRNLTKKIRKISWIYTGKKITISSQFLCQKIEKFRQKKKKKKNTGSYRRWVVLTFFMRIISSSFWGQVLRIASILYLFIFLSHFENHLDFQN
jgi:hypothetical protein